MSERVGIFIDGGHLRAAVTNVFSKIDESYWGDIGSPIKKHFPESTIDYEKLTLKIMEGLEQKIVYRRFYTCPPFRERGKGGRFFEHDARWSAYQKFKSYLNDAGYDVREGRMHKRRGRTYKYRVSSTEGIEFYRKPKFEQKAVDTFLARDIATLVAQKRINRICLVTGDSDFIPVVQCAKEDDGVFTTLWHAQGNRCSASKLLKKECSDAHILNDIEKEIRR